MSYSQNKEDLLILKYFAGKRGTVLDIGANDGLTFSNSRLLIENFWSALLVDPSKVCFEKLLDLYHKGPAANGNTVILNVAVGLTPGKATFYESDTLLGKGDKSLVSTLHLNETARWRGGVAFETTETEVVTFEKMLEMGSHKFSKYDFISIDAEGEDLNIIRQINFDALETKCVCVEFNGIGEQDYWDAVRSYGFRLLHKNAENLIYVR